VTFLFTDVEGSTKLLHELGAEDYATALAEHRRVIREAVAAHDGVEVDTQGDAFFVAFPTAPGALAAAAAAREELAIPVRMGLHSGTPLLTDEGYVGPDVHRAARIAASGHGRQILVSSSTAALLGPDQLRDLGQHRLKDLSAPERIYQLGDGDFPPLKSLHRTNLPVPTTPFLGRERELPQVLGLLEGTRLLTLTGPGGTGKTRLALQSAGLAAERYPDGVWWVPLAPLRDPQLVLSTASQAVGGRNGPAEHIGDKRMLLLFDNFEQVVAAAHDVAQLLSACPNLDVLVTSREPLHVLGEQEYPVPPLDHGEGVRFFVARARSVMPEFEADAAVSAISERLDDLPLALELAAARVKALTAQQILERLEQRLPLLTGGPRDAPERQRTLRATIEWSYDLLDPNEQQLFARLGVFRGGCTLEAAEAVGGADIDTLQSLVDKSLLRHTDDRYWMLETVREFGSEMLDEGVRRRHAEYFLQLVEGARLHLRQASTAWTEKIDTERDNFRAALDWLAATGETQLALRLAAAISRVWYLKGRWRETWRQLEDAVAADETPTAARAEALREAGAMAATNADFDLARRRLLEAQPLCERFGDTWGLAQLRFLLGYVDVEKGNFASARTPLEESLTMFRELADEHYEGIVAYNLAWAYEETGDFDRARELSEENLRRAEARGDDRIRFFSLTALALDAERRGERGDAASMLRDGLRLVRHAGDPMHTAITLMQLASIVVETEHTEVAAIILGRGLRTFEESGIDLPVYVADRRARIMVALEQQFDGETVERLLEQGRALSDEEAVELALAPHDAARKQPRVEGA
jgi:predicted ATPase